MKKPLNIDAVTNELHGASVFFTGYKKNSPPPDSREIDKAHTSSEVNKPTSPQNRKTTKPQVEKYTTHLKHETIKRIKIFAAENDIADYEVVQSPLDRYSERHK